MTDALASIVEELKRAHGCHTVVLYGSRARGEETDSSDYDVVGIRAGDAPEIHDARELDGIYLDAFVLSEGEVGAPRFREDPGVIRFRHGRALVEKDGWGTRLVELATERFRRGPKPLTSYDRVTIATWSRKMIARVARGGPEDVEANYRRAQLLCQLLEDYFSLRGRWFLGPRESFAWLRENDPVALALFEQAFEPAAPRGALRRLAEVVLAD